jgi:hypothetical protein
VTEDFPFLVGRVGITDTWSIDLPLACKRRVEDKQLVLWRPGFTIWLSAWGNNLNESIEQRKTGLLEASSPEKYDEKTATVNGRLYYSYRVPEAAEDQRAPAFQGFAFSADGHLQMAIYFDDEADVELAMRILRSADGTPPTLSDPSVFSQTCFVTKMVLEDRERVGYMYREQADNPGDSGWRFFSGRESQDYVDDPANTKLCAVATVSQLDRAVIPYLLSKPGHYGRKGNVFVAE